MMKQSFSQHTVCPFTPKAVCAAVLAAVFAGSVAHADTVNTAKAETQTQQLEEVVVKAKKRLRRKDSEVTGLGKVVKNADTLSKEQVLGIRDLTRYDPGIAVVEQGRGASSGYSIRGMDRNRVGLSVDGLPQIQSYTVDRTSASSGARNEIEYEHVQSVEINKGANSVEQGNGALGGSVSFRTKEAGDVIKDGQNWGLDTKSSYSSKNRQFSNSVAAAGRVGGFEALAVFTHRKGSETQVHPHAGQHEMSVERQGYDLTGGYFRFDNESNDAARPKAITSPTSTVREQLSAEQYTGKDRVLPDPMDSNSQSWLVKTGYRFSPEHDVGAVFEHTAQGYDIRDMTFEQYQPTGRKTDRAGEKTKGTYAAGGNPMGASTEPMNEHIAAGMQYSRTRYFDEQHRKARYGLHYRYRNPEQNGWLDHFRASFDSQNISLDSQRHQRHCSVYPTVDSNCRADISKPWSFYETERTLYGEKHNLLQLSAGKKWTLGFSKHDVRVDLGWNHFQSTLERKDFFRENAQVNGIDWLSGNGTQTDPHVYAAGTPQIVRQEVCRYDGKTVGVTGCDTRTIKGNAYHFALRDHMSLGKYVDWGIGVRYDRQKMTSDDSWTASGSFSNVSWNSGLVLKANKHLSFSHRISNGFRLPSFQELFGVRIDGYEKGVNDNDHYVGKFKPERALNNEFGVHLKGDVGSLEASFFRNHYQDLIAFSAISKDAPGFADNERGLGYRNAQTVKLQGFNLLGRIDWHSVWSKLPEGLYSTLAYNRIKLKKAKLAHEHFQYVYSPLLDAIQPSRYVFGIGYDQPEGKWGVNAVATYSQAKNPDELKGVNIVGYRTYNDSATKKTTKPWYTVDVSGYITLKDRFTLRAGVYNLWARRYSQWESLRQSAVGAVNRQQNIGDYARYAAPGRNYTLSLEMKF